MKSLSILALLLLTAAGLFAQTPRPRLVEVIVDSQDDGLKKETEEFTKNALIGIVDNLELAEVGKGDWALFVNVENIDGVRYAMTTRIGQQAKCTFTPHATNRESPPFACMSIIAVHSISIVPKKGIWSNIVDMVKYFDKQTR